MQDPLSGTRLTIHYADHAYNTPSWRWDSRLNRWPGHLLWLVAGGRGTIAMRGQATYDVGPGDCFLFDMRRVHHGRNDPQMPLEVLAVGFVASDGLGRELRPLWPWQLRHRRLPNRVAVAAGIERVLQDHRQGRESQAEDQLRTILSGIYHADHQPLCTGPERLLRERLEAVAEAMAANPTSRWSVTSLARRVGLGREHFTRTFTKLHGLAPARFLIQVRMDRAKALLRGSTDDITTIAQRLGYDDPAYFSRQFSQITGHSPRHYRTTLSRWDTGNVVSGG